MKLKALLTQDLVEIFGTALLATKRLGLCMYTSGKLKGLLKAFLLRMKYGVSVLYRIRNLE